MILGIGTDLVNIIEMAEMIKNRSFVERTFTANEISLAEQKSPSSQIEFYAGRFSVKESVAKALSCFIGDDAFDMRKIETLMDGTGRPIVSLIPPIDLVMKKHGDAKIHVSITHDGVYAQSFVIIERC